MKPVTGFLSDCPGRQLLYFAVNRTPDKSGTRLVSLDAPERAINFFPGVGVAAICQMASLFSSGKWKSVQPARPANHVARRSSCVVMLIDLGRARVSEVFGRYVVATAPSGVIA